MANITAGDRIRLWLERSHRNQGELASELGISQGHLSYLLSGKRSPSLALAVRIADLTGVPTDAWTVAA